MAEHNEFGKVGEQLAVAHLIKNGFQIKYRNYRFLKAEVDIIAQKGATLAIVEVKSRSTHFIDDLNDLIPPKKRKLLVLAADHYVVEQQLDVDVRFDIITIFKKNGSFKIDHIEDAFYHF
ncbi:YraN family protein [Cellulophaga sp. Hel_I_12]|uniref:YraN family protein n=1 Tax=Cellulophaga sp. Hel_I_12 TaxID=1249972 RepID=UPI0006463FA7|nr:YraN family protein [Cellulophaga sp. Hel_I_12]